MNYVKSESFYLSYFTNLVNDKVKGSFLAI